MRERALVSAFAVLVALLGADAAALARSAPSGLVYSTASALVVQRQPPARSCRALGVGLFERPDPRCTPGAANPAVTQASVFVTICRRGWTATVRPPESITYTEKRASMAAYGARGASSRYEYDHFVPLELGGAVNDARNLWPEPNYSARQGFYANPKDRLENALRRMVCDGSMSLSRAQRLIAGDWASAYYRYG
jgi:hypothetical protein